MPEPKQFVLPPEFASELKKYYNMASSARTTGEQNLAVDIVSPIYTELKSVELHYTEKQIHEIGGMKLISKVKDLRTGRPIAMAEMKRSGECTHEEVEQFLREARITAALEHPNIVPIYDIGLNEQAKPFFTMKFMKDDSLKKIIRELVKANPLYIRKYSKNMLLDIFLKVCDAVAFAHSCRVIHLDIKPGNVMIGEYGEVYICDWGLAKVLDSSRKEYAGIAPLDEMILNDITLNGVVKGTPGYMAPEQIERTFGNKSEQTDVYALGALLYTILSLKRPFDGLNAEQTMNSTTHDSIRPPNEVSIKEVPESLNAICMKSMRKKQSERYGSVDEVISDVRSYQEGFVTEAENATFFKALTLFVKRNKLLSSIILFSLIIIPAIIIIFIIKMSQNESLALLVLTEKDHEISTLHQSTDAELKVLKERERGFKRALVRERGILRGVVGSSLFNKNIPLIINSFSKQNKNIFSLAYSHTVLLSENPKGTGGYGMSLALGDAFRTGIILPKTFTIAFWAKMPPILKDSVLKIVTDEGGDDEVNFHVRENGSVCFNTWKDRTNRIQTPSGSVDPTHWNHFAIVHNGKDKPMQVFINGMLAGETITNLTMDDPWGWLKLSNFGCVIDELRVWGEPHSTKMIMANKATLSPAPDKLLAWFSFDNYKNGSFLEKCITGLSVQNDIKPTRSLIRYIERASGIIGKAFYLHYDDVFDTAIILPEVFTISLWIKIPDVVKHDSLKIVTDNGGSEELNFTFKTNGGVNLHTFSDDKNSVEIAAGMVKSGKWTHFTIVHKGDGRNMELFINGTLAGFTHTNFSQDLWGRLKLSRFGCEIAELRIWNIALEPDSVFSNKSNLSPETTNMLGWYAFSGKAVLTDISGNGNTAKIIQRK